MFYTLPHFNLAVNIWTAGIGPPAAPRVVTTGNLTPGRRANQGVPGVAAQNVAMPVMYLLLPINTDVRGQNTAGGSDQVEVPAGSGRMYTVLWVDDIGKGFANEHRFACMIQLSPFVPGPAPHGSFLADTPGSSLWTCPAGVTSIKAEAWGAGGNGGAGTTQGGGGGGGGTYAARNTMAVTPGNSYTLVVAAGGSGVATALSGDAQTVSAPAGGNAVNETGGDGGAAGTGDVQYQGGGGGGGDFTGSAGGGGGGSRSGAGTAGAPGATGGGLGGVYGGGQGGAAAENGQDATGTGGGGGGGGIGSTSGGAGNQGLIILTW